MKQKKYTEIEKYIRQYRKLSQLPANSSPWGNPRNLVMHFARIKLPHPSVAPNHEYFAGTQFYWDTYFTILGLTADRQGRLAKSMVDNLLYLYPKFGLIPARNSWTSLGRSQPPFLTRMAFEVYEAGSANRANRKWLDKVMKIAEKEYETVWTSGQRYLPESGLSRYRPKYLWRLLTTYESGWDVSSRFAGLVKKHVIPVDLNCLLYQYESDFVKWSKLKKDKEAEKRWKKAMENRRQAIDQYFWDKRTGFYYDNVGGLAGTLKTLAGYYPLWCGVADKKQAEMCIKKLKAFRQKGGLAVTEKMPPSLKQWDYPNGWAPITYIVYEGLRRYGYKKESKELAERWMACNLEVFERTGQLWEKYNVTNNQTGRRGRYPTQPGFAWTNAVFLKLLKDLRKS